MVNDKYLIATITGVTGAVIGLGYIIYKAKKAPVEPPEVVVIAPPEKPVTTGMITISEGITDLITSGTTAIGTIFDKITESIQPKPELKPTIETELPTVYGEPTAKPSEPTGVIESRTIFREEFTERARDIRRCIYKGDSNAVQFRMDSEKWVAYTDEKGEIHHERIA